jgi:hypothetical protein
MSERERALAMNETLFREVNEVIVEFADEHGMMKLEIVCECDNLTCANRLPIEHDEYEAVRAHALHYAGIPGHQDDTIEDVIAREREYFVVRKRRPAGARTLRPRPRPASRVVVGSSSPGGRAAGSPDCSSSR